MSLETQGSVSDGVLTLHTTLATSSQQLQQRSVHDHICAQARTHDTGRYSQWEQVPVHLHLHTEQTKPRHQHHQCLIVYNDRQPICAITVTLNNPSEICYQVTTAMTAKTGQYDVMRDSQMIQN